MDIVIGRGRHPFNSVGHSRFKQLIESYYDEYDRTNKQVKFSVVDKVLKAFQTMGCRFVRITSNGRTTMATVVPVEEWKDKIYHAFRNLRLAKKKEQANQNRRADTD